MKVFNYENFDILHFSPSAVVNLWILTEVFLSNISEIFFSVLNIQRWFVIKATKSEAKGEIKFLEKDLDYLREIKEKLFDREILAACLASGAAFVSPIGVLWDKLGPFPFSLICAWQFLLLIFSYISPPITSYPPNCKIFRRNVEWRNIFCGDCRIMPRLNCWAESTAASSFFTY